MSKQLLPRWVFATCMIFCLFLFVPGVSPGQGFGPGGTLTSLLLSGGLPNSPGYPLIGWLTDVWLQLPGVSSTPNSLNLLSAVLSALTCALMYRFTFEEILGRSPEGRPSSAHLGSLMALFLVFQFAVFWRHVFFFDRYMLVLVILFAELTYLQRRFSTNAMDRWRTWLTLGFMTSLGFCAHAFLFLIQLGLLGAIIMRRRPKSLRPIFALGTGLLLGQIPWIWSFRRAASQPYFNWGGLHDLESWLNLVRRSDKEPLALPTIEEFLRYLRHDGQVWTDAWGAWGAVLALFVVLSLILSKRRSHQDSRPWLLIWSAAGSFIPVALFIHFTLGDAGSWMEKISLWTSENYLLPTIATSSILVAVGFSRLLLLARNVRAVILDAVLVSSLGMTSWSTYRQEASSHFQMAEAWRALVNILPAEALLVTNFDSFYFPLQTYPTKVSGPLVVHAELFLRPWYIEALKKDPRFSEEARAALQDYEQVLEQNSVRGTVKAEALEKYLAALNNLMKDFELKSAAYIFDTLDFSPLRSGTFGPFSVEPDLFAGRIFKDSNEVRPLNLDSAEPHLRQILSTPVRGPQKMWVELFQNWVRAHLEQRAKWIKPVSNEEASRIEKLLVEFD